MVNEEEESRYGRGAFPNYYGLPLASLPNTFAEFEKTGRPTVSQLKSPGIVHEWTLKPGKRLFWRFFSLDVAKTNPLDHHPLVKKFGRKWRETICAGKDSPYGQFKDGLVGHAALPTTIADSVLAVGFSVASFWYPLAIYLGLLLAKTGLKVYCEP